MERNDELEELVIDLGSVTDETQGNLGPVKDTLGNIPLTLSDD